MRRGVKRVIEAEKGRQRESRKAEAGYDHGERGGARGQEGREQD